MSMPATAPVQLGAFAVWEDAFSPAELDAIERYGDSLRKEPANVGGDPAELRKVRVTQVAWIGRLPASEWIFAEMEKRVQQINQLAFRFELFGLLENMQYTVYEGSEGGHYNWHVDQGGEAIPQKRKISISLQLSDDHAYEGCELELIGNGILTASRKRGTLIAFPAYVLHRVTPITHGTRKSLVAWVNGPEFK
jgi:PKHD-type hydroxylase